MLNTSLGEELRERGGPREALYRKLNDGSGSVGDARQPGALTMQAGHVDAEPLGIQSPDELRQLAFRRRRARTG